MNAKDNDCFLIIFCEILKEKLVQVNNHFKDVDEQVEHSQGDGDPVAPKAPP